MKHAKLFQALMVVLFVAALAGTYLSAPLPAAQLTAQEKRGEQIYLKGTSHSGQEITALLGKEGTEVPGSVLACANCHGRDGRGRPEGGVVPSNITWQALTKPYGVVHASGRKHPPYTERLLKRAITMGIDPAGNQLQVAMPRYRMSLQDVADLAAYVRHLGKNSDPGLSDEAIRLGAILPPAGQLSEMSQAVKAALTAYFEEINKTGGIYNRRIDLRFAELTDSPEGKIGRVESFLNDSEIFALTGSFIAGADEEVATLLKEKEVPLVGAFTLYPQGGFPLNRYVFYLYSGLEEQGRALASFAAKRSDARNPPAVIIYSGEKVSRDVAGAIKKECRESGWESVEDMSALTSGVIDAALLARNLKRKRVEVVFFLSPNGAESAIFQEAVKVEWKPIFLIPGSLAGKDIFEAPKDFDGRIFLSFPILPSDQTTDAMAEYRRLAEGRGLRTHSLASQLTALSSAKVLVEGLKRAGRDVSREKLIEALERFYEFRTGLTPAVTYNPNRRIGAMGSHIVSVDLKAKSLSPISEWIVPE